MKQNAKTKAKYSGQTLIETIVAIFVLTTGLSTGLALATYAFGSSTDLVDRVTATGLAREGIEVIRRMRDSNWLAAGTLSDCPELGAGQKCYPTWLTQAYAITGASGPGNAVRINFNTNTGDFALQGAPDYRLKYNPDGAFSYTPGSAPDSNFFRKIQLINADVNPPYSATHPLLLVKVSVWWYGKRCNNNLPNLNPPTQDTSCKIVTEEYLTNWKNY